MTGDVLMGGRVSKRAGFSERARRIASDMLAQGLSADDVVAILMRNDPVFLEIIEACRFVGLSYVSINWHSAPKEIEHILIDSNAQALYGHVDLIENAVSGIPDTVRVVAAPLPALIKEQYNVADVRDVGFPNLEKIIATSPLFNGEPERLRGIFAYTSGSTGRPKGIVRSTSPDGPDQYQVFAQLARDFLFAKPGDSMLIAAPLYHSAPNALAQFAMAAGDMDIILDAKFDPERFLQTVEQERVTHAYIVPTMMVRLLKLPEHVRNKYDTSSLRFALSTGSPCPKDVKQAVTDWLGPILFETYGASELGFMTLISAQEAEEKPGSVGRVLPGGSAKILDDDLNELPVNATGTIFIHLPMFGSFEYSNQDGALVHQTHEGFTTVGDVGYIDEDGYIFISDRKKEMIISGGANVFPSEIEAELIQMPVVQDCAVFGAPDPEFGETIIAAVQLIPGGTLSLSEMQAFLSPRLAKFKVPRKLDLHEALPREDSGKIFKARLRAPYWKDAGRSI